MSTDTARSFASLRPTLAPFPSPILTAAFRLTVLFVVLASAANAQSNASCTFAPFPLSVVVPRNGTVNISPAGINDFGTVVGTADWSGSSVGVIRWVGGGLTFVKGTTSLVDRNDSGKSIGYAESGNAVQVSRDGSVAPIKIEGNRFSVARVGGINNWGSIVGVNFDGPTVKGFKRWREGGAFRFGFPAPAGTVSTWPARINDKGIIVGAYYVGPPGIQLPENGFIYHEGEWATLNYPNEDFTNLVGLTNDGVVAGNAHDAGIGFIYDRDAFKVIQTPDGSSTSIIGISPRLGLILGTATFSGTKKGFIAKCQ